jgi:hypothetical protein
MMETLRGWLVAVVASSMLVGIVQSMISAGSLRRIAAMTAGLFLMLILLRPLLALDLYELLPDRDVLSDEVLLRQTELEKADGAELKRLIEERTAAYISDKAAELGFFCTAEVTAVESADGIPYPYSAELDCPPSAGLSAYMETELNIPKERQVYHGT